MGEAQVEDEAGVEGAAEFTDEEEVGDGIDSVFVKNEHGAGDGEAPVEGSTVEGLEGSAVEGAVEGADKAEVIKDVV